MDTAEKDKQRLMAKLVYSGLLLVELFNRPLKKLVGSAHCRCTGHWNDKHLIPQQRGKKHFKRTKWGKIIVQRSKARGLYREISESREKEEKRKRKSENSRDLWSTEKWWFPFKTFHLLLIHWIAPGIHQRRAGGGGGEGGTAETGHGRVPPDGRNVWELQGQNTGRAPQHWAAVMATPGWKCLSAGKAHTTERLFHQLFPCSVGKSSHKPPKPIWGQKCSSTRAHTARYYQCPHFWLFTLWLPQWIKHHPVWNLVFPLPTGRIFKSRFILLHRENVFREREWEPANKLGTVLQSKPPPLPIPAFGIWCW